MSITNARPGMIVEHIWHPPMVFSPFANRGWVGVVAKSEDFPSDFGEPGYPLAVVSLTELSVRWRSPIYTENWTCYRLVPDAEQSTLHQVVRAWITHENDDHDDPVDWFWWCMLMALLPPGEAERLTDENDWPDTDELLRIVARSIDDRVAAARTLGTALGRLR